MGMAAIGVALYKYVMKYSPSNCEYFNRDRFVLSNGMRASLPLPRPWKQMGETDKLPTCQAMHAYGNISSCTSSA